MKKTYKKPQLKKINIDNEISLVMMSESTPPGNPPWSQKLPDNQKEDPFKTHTA